MNPKDPQIIKSSWFRPGILFLQNLKMICITLTMLYNEHHEKWKAPIYIGKTGVHTIFLILAQIVDCGYLLEPPDQAVLMSANKPCFKQIYSSLSTEK